MEPERVDVTGWLSLLESLNCAFIKWLLLMVALVALIVLADPCNVAHFGGVLFAVRLITVNV